MDIVFYGQAVVADGPTLEVPHARWRERPFVLAPLADLHQPGADPPGSLLAAAASAWAELGGEAGLGVGGVAGLRRVLPAGRGALLRLSPRPFTRLMAIVNVTPDSFSAAPGAPQPGPEEAARAALDAAARGAAVVDLGAHSTRPGAPAVSLQEELDRLLPALEAVARRGGLGVGAGLPPGERPLLSVDTFRPAVARAALATGVVDVVNDVSGGTEDDGGGSDGEGDGSGGRPGRPPGRGMLSLVAAHPAQPALVLGHCRGPMAAVHSPASSTGYGGDPCAVVASELSRAVAASLAAGVAPWRLILDPGLGFSKPGPISAALLRGLGGGGGGGGEGAGLRRGVGALRRAPWLVGASRKAFLAGLLPPPPPAAGGGGGGGGGGSAAARPPGEREWATAAATAAAAAVGAAFVRVHDLAAQRDVAAVADALLRTPDEW